MTDPAIWEELDELEKSLGEVKLYCGIFFLALFAAVAGAVVVFIKLKDIMAALKGMGL